MTDLERFCVAWIALLVFATIVRLGPWLLAHLLARAFRTIARLPD